MLLFLIIEPVLLEIMMMKNRIKLGMLLLALHLNAQTIKPLEDNSYRFIEDNVYRKDINGVFDKFLGTWEYSNGPYYLKVIITKVEKEEQGVYNGVRTNKLKIFEDRINCDYIYKYNGQVVYNVTTPYQVVNGELQASLIGGSYIENSTSLFLGYSEPTLNPCGRERHGSLTLTYINNGTPQLTWSRTDKTLIRPESHCPNGVYDRSAYQIPANIVLTKI